MLNFVLGAVFGIVISTTGVAPLARMLDHGVNQIKSIAHEQAK
jgi:hypothetical protein